MTEKSVDILIKKREYRKGNDFRQYYVTGAIGGFQNPYDFRLTFFNDNINELIVKLENLKPNTPEEMEKKELPNLNMPFDLQCEIIMTKKAAYELYKFLEKEFQKDLKKQTNSNTEKT